jgi:hypothetical protein
MGANHVRNSERPATSNASCTTWPVQPSLVNEPFSDLGALRPHFENDVVLTRVINLRPKSSLSVPADQTAVVAPLQGTNKSNPPPGDIMAAQNRLIELGFLAGPSSGQYKISKIKLSISITVVTPATESTKASRASW